MLFLLTKIVWTFVKHQLLSHKTLGYNTLEEDDFSRWTAMLIDWNFIDTVFIDMDGTLLDLNFDNEFWTRHLPLRCSELLNQPLREVQDKIRDEMKIHITDYKYIIETEISKLSYCRCVLQEVLRLYTIIPFVNRTNIKPYRIEETQQVIPKNTTILIPLTLMNRSDKIWENPTSFNPERFMDTLGHNSAKHGYFPFGYGSRTCIGSNLAITEGLIMMIKLLHQFDLYPDPNFKPDIIAGISLISKNGINVRLEKRTNKSI